MSDIQIAVLSDIHGNRLALEAVLKDIENRGIETIIDLGDSLYGPLDPGGTAELLIKNNIPSIRGNEDRLLLDPSEGNPTLEYVLNNINSTHIEWLENLSVTEVRQDFFLCHASPDKDNEYLI